MSTHPNGDTPPPLTLPDAPDYPWERRPDENDVQWRGFQHYRDSEVATHAATADWLRDNGHTRATYKHARNLVGTWSHAYDWVERRHAWKLEEDRQAREAFLDERRKAARRRATQLAAGQRLCTAPVEAFIRRLANKEHSDAEWLQRVPMKELYQLAMQGARALPMLGLAESREYGDMTPGQSVDVPFTGTPERVGADESLARLEEVAAILVESKRT